MNWDRQMPACACLVCGGVLDAATESSGDSTIVPQPDDITMCIHCGHIMAFSDELKMRELTPDERRMVERDPRVLRMSEAMSRIRARN
jgi:hypothetical protein